MLECENDLKQLYKSGFRLINLTDGLDEYFRIRSKLRCTYERFLIEESDFSLANNFETKLWEECYEKPINWIQSHLETVSSKSLAVNTINLRRLKNVLISLLDEGSTFFQLLLRSDKIITKFRYKILIYSSILLRKRENLLLKSRRAFNLLQEAITFEPFRGFGYFILAQWTLEDGDELLAIYWALISFNVSEDKQEKALEFIKSISSKLAISPSFSKVDDDCDNDLIVPHLLQMVSHALLGQLTGNSHLKHLDQLSHSQLKNLDKTNLKSLKYLISILWITLGMFNNPNQQKQENLQVSSAQTCILAKLFQVHIAFIENEAITGVLFAFCSNEMYSRLFTGNNYKIISKINNFAYETLNNLLKKLLVIDTTVIYEKVYFGYFVLETFSDFEPKNLIEYFIEKGLYHQKTDNEEIQLISVYEKSKKTERSMKLLTHQFLTTKLQNIESKIEPKHLPWTIPDYQTLLRQFQRIAKLILSRQIRILITLSLLQELDLDKSQREIREIIRFLHERIDSNDPCIKLENGKTELFDNEMLFINSSYRHKLKLNHWRAVENFIKTEKSNVKIICSDSQSEEYLTRTINKDQIFYEI